MKVVMLKDVKGVGQRGTVVEIADGFALNSLIPQGKAVQATPDKIAEVQKRIAAEKASADAKAQQLAQAIRALDGKSVAIKAKANDRGHLFKTIKKDDIAKELKIDADLIDGVDEGIKSTGTHEIKLSGYGASGSVNVVVESQ